MSYVINKTDGSVLTEVVDGTIDQISTDLTLVGKNATTYGELFNENFIKLLENFANTTQPNSPILGQLWYDTTDGRLKVYDGTGFKVSGGTIVSTSIPSGFAQGDIWIDSQNQQMYFNDGSAPGGILVGPLYTYDQGKSGWEVQSVVDTRGIAHTILLLYVGQRLLGIFATEAFSLLNDIPGFTGDVTVGFTPAYSAIKINATASTADSLVAVDGSIKTAESFLQVSPADGYSVSNGTLRILNDVPLILGASQNTELLFVDNTLQINPNIINQNFQISNFNSSGLKAGIYLDGSNEYVGVFTNTPTATLDVAGDTRIRGNLTVEGSTTTINTTNVEIEDLLIELGKVSEPSNSTAEGGGILLAAGDDGDKTITWNTSYSSWVSSENFNVENGKVYKINNFEVLSQTQLGVTVTSAPGLTTIGQLDILQVDNININNNVISFLNVSVGDGTIYLAPQNSGTVDVSSKRITSLANPVTDTDAVNKGWVTAATRSIPLGLSVNIGAKTELELASDILSKVYPVENYDENTYLRVWCIDTEVAKEYRLISSVWVYQTDVV